MIDVFVRMAAAPASADVVAESIRRSAGADFIAQQHQVVTLFGVPTVEHLAWALAAANRGGPDTVWQISVDGSALAAELCVSTAALQDDAAALLSSNGPQLRSAVAHLISVRSQGRDTASIRVPITIVASGDFDSDAMLAQLREAEGDVDNEPVEDELAA